MPYKSSLFDIDKGPIGIPFEKLGHLLVDYYAVTAAFLLLLAAACAIALWIEHHALKTQTKTEGKT